MIFYGTNSSRLKNGKLNNVQCPNCENQTSMTYTVFGKYAYLYWIPVFPLGKTNILECDHCKRTYDLKELPEPVKRKFDLEKHTSIPFLHFSGLAIIAGIIGFIGYSNAKDKENTAIYINEPAVGDVYYMDSDTHGRYTSMKIRLVSSDSVFVAHNTYEIDRKSAIDEIDVPENYDLISVGYSKEEILSLYNDDTIYEISRD